MIELKNENFTIADDEIIIKVPELPQKQKIELSDLIIDNIRIRKELEYRAQNPMALNYASFAQWISELLVPKTEKEIQEEREKIIWNMKKC